MENSHGVSPDFLVAFAFTLELEGEGEFVDNPQDPGGATRWGITERVARRHGYTGDMRDLPRSVAQKIGWKEYWQGYSVGLLTMPLSLVVYDSVYNSGDLGVRWLQKVLPGVTVDGKLGPLTAHAASLVEPKRLAALVVAQRLEALTGMGNWGTFGKGWSRRCVAVLRRAMEG